MNYDRDKLGDWHYNIDLGDGKSTVDLSPPYNAPGDKTHGYINTDYIGDLIKKIYGDESREKTVLDVACNSGAQLFSCQKICGIRSGFGFDIREQWINQANWLKENIKFYNTSNLVFKRGSFEVLDEIGMFDVSFFNGIFYHLANPYQELEKVSAHTSDIITINTMYAPSADTDAPALILKLEATGDDHALSGVECISWVPNGEEVLIRLLKHLGFCQFHLLFKDAPNRRLCLIASKISGRLDKLKK
jgi:SAM-dependent methyltransferase